jgi:Fic family protein
VGRLLIALMLHQASILRQPLLYLSLYFKQHRDEYYRLLDAVRREGDWEAWLDFFLEGVVQTAGSAVESAHRLLATFRDDERRIGTLARNPGSLLKVYGVLRRRPVAAINDIAARAAVSFPTAARAVETLVEAGIARELTGGRRNRVFAYDRYLAILNEGTEPL